MKINKNEIHIYRTRTDLTLNELSVYEKYLSADERIKAGRYKFDHLKNNYTACRGFLREIISGYTGMRPGEIEFSYSEFGKPFLNGSNIRFNVSHSGKAGIIAVNSDDELGIDIELIREVPDLLTLSRRFFSKTEIAELNKSDSSKITNSFFYCWTRKEAFIKALGTGLQHPLNSFSVTTGENSEPRIIETDNDVNEAGKWKIYDLKAFRDYISSLAIRALNKNIVFKN
ncbi:MAG: 4'-phosphopantetheinyl transferase superfamily protein [Bacteroidetes bacterium]|nr:4'-phosphopantetheinyl transferase superfamily protein [Bacteroidota bacterium]